jgi:hypothetical protein
MPEGVGMGSERRRTPRIVLDPPIRACVIGLDIAVSIAEVSFGGFRVESPVAFEHQTEYQFLVLPQAGDKAIRFDATAVHSRVLSSDPVVRFETGFAFADGSQSWLGIEALTGSVLCVLET